MRRPALGRAATLAAVALILSAQGAWADNLVADGDGLTPVANSDMSFGIVCSGTTTTKAVVLAATRLGAAGSTNVFKNGSTVSVTVQAVSGPGLSATGGGSISIPANWSTQSNGTLTGSVSASVQLTAGAVGPFSGSVTFDGTGINTSNATIDRDDVMLVTATIVNCDTTPPVLNLPGPITAEATGPAGASVTYVATASDANPASPAVSCTPASGTTFGFGETTVNCSATDAANNTANGSFTVTVVDTTAPSIVGTPGATSAEATGPSGATVTYTDPTASDVVDGSVAVTCTPASGSAFALGTTPVSCSATDSHSNTATTGFDVIVSDTTDPILVVPTDITAEATGPSGAAVSFTASATDIVDGSIDPVCTPASGSTFGLGSTSVSCTATDEAGNATTDGFTVTVVDTTAPAITVPADITEEATGSDGATATFLASATDIVDGAVTVDCLPASGTTFPLGATTVTCSAVDAAGNSSNEIFQVNVVDTTAPDLSIPADQLLEATGPGGAVATFTASATDIVDGSVPVICSADSGDTFPLGPTLVTCSATDAAGNLATGGFTITVQDTTAPVLTVPGDITAEATGPSGATVTYAASATDIVDGSIDPDCTPSSGSTFALGSTSVSCTANDNAGNSTTLGFTVTVVDTTAPAITVPGDITAEATGPSGAAVSFSTSASDLVDGPMTPTCSATSGDTFPLGTTTVSCSATDLAGNTGNASFDVSVVDTTAPAVTVPGNITTGPTSILGAPVTYRGQSATDIVDGSVPVTCAPPSGSTFGFGTTTVTCSATDDAGNTGSATFSITVNGFTFAGFYQPVDMAAVNTVKNGSTVPVKWELFGAGGVEFTDTASVMTGWPKAAKVSCDSFVGLPEDVIETTATGGTTLRYDTAGGQFVYNWQTPKQAGTCWRLDVKFVDGSTRSATFKLK